MFEVIFEVKPRAPQWDTYLNNAKMLKPELENIDGFVDNVRYRSLKRPGWILSLSSWRNEKAVVRWRTHMGHHLVQEKGRGQILEDYHLRVGEVTADNRVPHGMSLLTQRLDDTEVGEGTRLLLIEGRHDPATVKDSRPEDVASKLGILTNAAGLKSWDVFEAVLEPGRTILMLAVADEAAATKYRADVGTQYGARLREVRVIRDYGMFDRREAPQYYPAVER